MLPQFIIILTSKFKGYCKMKQLIKISIAILLAAGLLTACKSMQKSAADPPHKKPAGFAMAQAPVIIYKTKKDYARQVPVILDEEKNSLASYPAPADLYYRGEFAMPKQLQDNYLLDRRGIDENAAFLSITYEEYTAMKQTPPADSLMKLIIDPDPFLIIYHCGSRNEYDNLEAQLNLMITSGDLQRCIRLDE